MSALRALTRTNRLARPAGRCFHASARRQQHFLDADAQTFHEAISNKDKVVLVDFYATWCGPCKMLSPILEKLTNDASVTSGSGQQLDLVTVDTDVEPHLAQKYNITSLPTVIAFRDVIVNLKSVKELCIGALALYAIGGSAYVSKGYKNRLEHVRRTPTLM